MLTVASRRGWWLVALASLASTASACSDGTGPPRPPAPPQMQWLLPSPIDVTTGLDALDIEVGLQPGPSDSQVLGPLAAETTLVTWPDAKTLASTATAAPGPTMNGGLDFRPAQPVTPGWYAAVLPALPANVSVVTGAFRVLSDGRLVVRVRVGSGPVLRNVNVCPKADGTTEVVVTFSEDVHAATTSSTALVVALGTAAAPTPCLGGLFPLVGRSASSYEIICGATVATTDVLAITIGAGLLSDSGVGVAPLERVAGLQTLTPGGVVAGCAALEIDP